MKSIILILLFYSSILLPAPFRDNKNGTITDSYSGFTFQKCSAGQEDLDCESDSHEMMSWEEALDYCNNLKLGKRIWRLPNINELLSLVDVSKSNPSLDLNFFPNTKKEAYWTSTSSAGLDKYAWNVNFLFGFANVSAKTNSAYVRCVSN